MRAAPTPPEVLGLKEEAKALKLSAGITQSAALARIAQREGFRSWEELIGLAGGSAAVLEVKRGQEPTDAKARRDVRRQRFVGGRPS